MVVGAQAVQKKACPPHAIKFTRGGTTKKQASSRKKFEGQTTYTKKRKKQKENKNTTPRKSTKPATRHCQELSCSALLPWHGTDSPSTLLWSCQPQDTARRPCGWDEGGGWEGSTLMRSWFPTTPPPLMSLSFLISSPLPEAWVLFLGRGCERDWKTGSKL